MRFDESPFRCPYPMWLTAITCNLPPILAFIIFLLWQNDCPPPEWKSFVPVFIVFVVLFWQILWLPYTIWWELANFLVLSGTVWAAFQDGVVFGIGYAIVLGLLLIPYYHTRTLGWCFARQERKKLQSLVGRDGITIRHVEPFHMVVEIDSEQFDACPYYNGNAVQGLPDGVPVTVLRTRLIGIDVEQKKE